MGFFIQSATASPAAPARELDLAPVDNFGETAKNAVPQFFAVESGFRFYSPELGRWLSRDPIGEEGGENLYVLTINDSLSLTDYLGLRRYLWVIAGDSKTFADTAEYKGWWTYYRSGQYGFEGHEELGSISLGAGGARIGAIRDHLSKLDQENSLHPACDAIVSVYWIGQNDITDLVKTSIPMLALDGYRTWRSLAEEGLFLDWKRTLDELVEKSRSKRLDTLVIYLPVSYVRQRGEVAGKPAWRGYFGLLASLHKEMSRSFNSRMAAYSPNLGSLTSHSKAQYIDISSVKSWAEDGSHHSAEGNKLIADRIHSAVERWLNELAATDAGVRK